MHFGDYGLLDRNRIENNSNREQSHAIPRHRVNCMHVPKTMLCLIFSSRSIPPISPPGLSAVRESPCHRHERLKLAANPPALPQSISLACSARSGPILLRGHSTRPSGVQNPAETDSNWASGQPLADVPPAPAMICRQYFP